MGFLLDFFTWIQSHQSALGTIRRAHFIWSPAEAEDRITLHSPPTLCELLWVFPTQRSGRGHLKQQLPACAEKIGTQAEKLHHEHLMLQGMLQGKESAQTCLQSVCRWKHMCDLSLQLFCSPFSCNPLPQMLLALLATHGSCCRGSKLPCSQFLLLSTLQEFLEMPQGSKETKDSIQPNSHHPKPTMPMPRAKLPRPQHTWNGKDVLQACPTTITHQQPAPSGTSCWSSLLCSCFPLCLF